MLRSGGATSQVKESVTLGRCRRGAELVMDIKFKQPPVASGHELDSAALMTRVPGAVLGAGEFRMRPLEFTAQY